MSGSIPTELPDAKGEDKVEKVAEETLSQVPSPETEAFNISFSEYNQKECLVNSMDKHNAKTALKILRDVGVYFTDETNFKLHSLPDIEIKPVYNDGSYTDIFRGLNPEYHQRVKEIKYKEISHKKNIGEDVNLRVFFTTIESPKLFYVIAIRGGAYGNTHYDTDKSHHARDFRHGGNRHRKKFR